MTIPELLARRADAASRETQNAIYIGKRPFAEQAYLHVIYKSAGSEIRATIADELEFPQSLVDHFEEHNGGYLFRASLTCFGLNLFGCLPKTRTVNRSLSDESLPIDLRTSNLRRWEWITIAAYGYDGSTVLASRNDGAVRCCRGKDLTTTRREWPSVQAWLTSELDRLSRAFGPDDSCLTTCQGLLP